MKLTKSNKVGIFTTLSMLMSAAVVNATNSTEAVSKSLGDWVIIVAEILSILCLVVFALYMGRFVTLKTGKEEPEERVIHGVRNGMMTTLVGMAFCQAAVIVARLCF